MAIVCRYLWTWHLSAHHVSQLGIQLISMTIHFHESCHSFECFRRMHSTVALCVCPVQSCYQVFLSCCPMFKGDLKKFYLYSLHNFCVSIFESIIWLLHSHHSITMFWVSCCRCGAHHGPPSMRLFPSTSAHHPGNSLRNNIWYLEICMP